MSKNIDINADLRQRNDITAVNKDNARNVIQYPYSDFLKDVYIIAQNINMHGENSDWRPNGIIAIARGGLTFATYLAHRLGIKEVTDADSYLDARPKKFSPYPGRINQYLVVDDISDSGQTLSNTVAAIKAKAAEEQFDIELLTATLWVRNTTTMYPDIYARSVNDDSWIEYPWEGDITSIKEGFFIEMIDFRRQVFAPPAYLGILPLTDEDIEVNPNASVPIQLVNEPEYATVFATAGEAYTVMDELRSRSDAYKELFAIGNPILSQCLYNVNKHMHYWKSIAPRTIKST